MESLSDPVLSKRALGMSWDIRVSWGIGDRWADPIDPWLARVAANALEGPNPLDPESALLSVPSPIPNPLEPGWLASAALAPNPLAAGLNPLAAGLNPLAAGVSPLGLAFSLSAAGLSPLGLFLKPHVAGASPLPVGRREWPA